MRTVALLFFFPCFMACQQGREKLPLSEAGIVSPATSQPNTPTAANIVFKSVDGGQTWQDVSAGLPENIEVGGVYDVDGNVYLGANGGLYHSTNPPSVEAWEKEVFVGDRITHLFSGKTGLYAGIYDHGLFQKIPGTSVWKPMHGALKDKTVRTVFEAADGAIFVGCDSGIFKTVDGGESWKQVFSEVYINSFTAAGDVLICGTFKGLLRSTDAGEHWDWVLTEDGNVQKTERIGGLIVAITRGAGTWQEVAEDPEGMANRLRASADGGKTWQRIDEQLSSARLRSNLGGNLAPVWIVNDIKQAGDYLFCSLDTGIFRSSDLGQTWELVFPSYGMKLLQLAVSGKEIYAVSVIGC